MIRLVAAATAAAALTTAAHAHHGFGTFDLNQDVDFTGTFVRLDFVNPHSWLYFDVVGPDGIVIPYRCEMRGATVLRRSGWSPDMFTAGETITVTGAPDKFDPNSCYVSTVTFSDGSSIDRYGQRTPPSEQTVASRPARLDDGTPNIFGDWASEQVVMTDPRGLAGTLVPLSTADEFEPGGVPEGATPFPGSRGADPSLRSFASLPVQPTDRGQALADAYEDLNPETNPRMRCESTSILFDWTFDGMIHRISQSGDTITVQYGQYDLVRTIYMDLDAHPDGIEPSRAGHSIGHWEDDALVVDTVGFAPGIVVPPVHHGDQLHIVERFWLDADTGGLRRSYVAEDPDFFVGELANADVVLPSALPFAPDTCQELSFVDYSEEAERAIAEQQGGEDAPEPNQPWWRFWD